MDIWDWGVIAMFFLVAFLTARIANKRINRLEEEVLELKGDLSKIELKNRR